MINSPHITHVSNTKLDKRMSINHCPYCLCSYISQHLEQKENKHILNDISQDSAICMDDNLYDCLSLSDKSCNVSEFSIERSDSAVNISNIIQVNSTNTLQQNNFPVTNLLKQYELELNESLSYDSPTPMTKNKNCLNTCKLSSSILSKLSHLNFSPMFKQYVLTNPCQHILKMHQKQKYTPLPSPLPIPAKVAKLSNPEYGSRSTFTSDENYSNISSKSLKGDHMKLDKQKDKPLFLVLLFFSWDIILYCGI